MGEVDLALPNPMPAKLAAREHLSSSFVVRLVAHRPDEGAGHHLQRLGIDQTSLIGFALW